MKRILMVLGLIICLNILTNDISAKESCTVTNNIKTCTEFKNKIYYKNVYTYTDNNLKQLSRSVQEQLTSDKKKVLYRTTKIYYSNKKLSYLRVQNYKSYYVATTTNYYNTGVTKKITYDKNYSTYNSKDVKDYNSKGVLSARSYLEKYKNGKTKKTIKYTIYSNGKIATSVQKNYTTSQKVTYALTRKYTSKGKANYYYSVNTASNKITVTQYYNSAGKVVKKVQNNYDKKNKLTRGILTTYHSSGRKYLVRDSNYNVKTAKLTKRTQSYYKNTKNNNLYSKRVYKYNSNGVAYNGVFSYYDKNSFKYNGYLNRNYNVKTKKIASQNKVMYYVGTSKIYTKTSYTIKDGKVTHENITYYNGNNVRTKLVNKVYDTKGSTTSNLTSYFSSNKITLKVGYSYQSSTYKYHRYEYNGGVLRLNDVTTYKNKTIVKTNYLRQIYNSKGIITNKENYTYTNGEISSSTTTKSGKTTNGKAVAKSYPVQKGLITSPSWFYPASFGGGWHPGIDVATYKVATYGYAQPIKVFNDAQVIKRNNSCATTNSNGCGDGFGNYVVVATQYNGKFYTILYAHQTKLSTSNSNHKTVLNKDKTGYKKNEVIGYVGNSGYSTGYHVHIQVQEHTYAKSINDIKERMKKSNNNALFNVSYNVLGNGDIQTINPDVLFNLKYQKSW